MNREKILFFLLGLTTSLLIASVWVQDIVEITTNGYITFEGATNDTYETTLTANDPTHDRIAQIPDYNGIMWITGDRFARPHLLVSTAWSATIGKTDGSTNYVIGSSVGPMCWREEQNKGTRSWVEVPTGLDITADDIVDNEGVEIYFAGINETLGDGWLNTSNKGGCFEVGFTNVNISATDQFVIGWRIAGAFDTANDYTQYTEYSVVGVTTNDGSVFSIARVASGATLSDDSGTNIADGGLHRLKVCINATTRVPTAYLDDVAITMTNTGVAKTTATEMAPFVSYMHDDEAADSGIIITRFSIWR